MRKNNLLPGMLHHDFTVSCSLIDAILKSNSDAKIEIHLDWDDTICNWTATIHERRPVINSHVVRYLVDLFQKYGAHRFELCILSSRAEDNVVETRIGKHATIDEGIQQFYSEMTELLNINTATDLHEILIRKKNIRCLLGNHQYHIRDNRNLLWSSEPFTCTASALHCEAQKNLLEISKKLPQAELTEEHVLKAHYLLKILKYDPDRFFIFIDDSFEHLNAMRDCFRNALCIQVEPVVPSPQMQPKKEEQQEATSCFYLR